MQENTDQKNSEYGNFLHSDNFYSYLRFFKFDYGIATEYLITWRPEIASAIHL